jgi:hypothetical protein
MSRVWRSASRSRNRTATKQDSNKGGGVQDHLGRPCSSRRATRRE